MIPDRSGECFGTEVHRTRPLVPALALLYRARSGHMAGDLRIQVPLQSISPAFHRVRDGQPAGVVRSVVIVEGRPVRGPILEN
jgi:hypothetical protein